MNDNPMVCDACGLNADVEGMYKLTHKIRAEDCDWGHCTLHVLEDGPQDMGYYTFDLHPDRIQIVRLPEQ